jgi:hypothetical protein
MEHGLDPELGEKIRRLGIEAGVLEKKGADAGRQS